MQEEHVPCYKKQLVSNSESAFYLLNGYVYFVQPL